MRRTFNHLHDSIYERNAENTGIHVTEGPLVRCSSSYSYFSSLFQGEGTVVSTTNESSLNSLALALDHACCTVSEQSIVCDELVLLC